MARKIIMSWSKCKIEVGKTGDNDAMASSLVSIGTINDKSTTLGTEDGEKLTATATGGVVVAEEEGEPVVTITTRVKEMDFDTENMFTGAVKSQGGDELTVKTNVVPDDFSIKLTPKNIGAVGIKARRTHVSFRPGSSEEEGQFVDLTFKILQCEDGELYKKFKVKASDWATVSAPTFTPATWAEGSTLSVALASATTGATIKYTTDGSVPSASNGMTYSEAISLSATTTIKAIAIKDGAVSEVVTATFTKPA